MGSGSYCFGVERPSVSNYGGDVDCYHIPDTSQSCFFDWEVREVVSSGFIDLVADFFSYATVVPI